jgi:hypothetical protein
MKMTYVSMTGAFSSGIFCSFEGNEGNINEKSKFLIIKFEKAMVINI